MDPGAWPVGGHLECLQAGELLAPDGFAVGDGFTVFHQRLSVTLDSRTHRNPALRSSS